MRALPDDLEDSDLAGALRDGWGLDAADIEYVAVGGGSYHWRVDDAGGRRHWVTADDLDHKGYLGGTGEAAFDALCRALGTALALREHGLDFVVAPVPAAGGEAVRRLGSHHAVALYPFVEGRAREWGKPLVPAEAAELTDMLVRLHAATPVVATVARRADVQPAERPGLERALRELDWEWTAGPLSEPARAVIASSAARVRQLLDTFDRLADEVATTGAAPVITHGEPHPANVIAAGGRLLLVDWDTAALAPPERDLWMLDQDGRDELARYAEAAGRPVDGAAIRLYRLRWRLDDISSFLKRLRSPHRRTADTEHALRALAISIDG